MIWREPKGPGKVIWIFLFAIFIPLYYLNLISTELTNFQEALELRSTSGIPIYLTAFQQWTFDIVSLFWDALIVSICVGLLFYFIKGLPTYVGLLFGVLSRYAILFGISFVWWLKSPTSFFAEFVKHFDLRLLSLQFLLTLVFSYIGTIYGQRAKYFDPRDRDLRYLCGVPKKIWFLLLIAFNPVVEYLSKLTIVQIYSVTDKITSMAFWKDTFSLSNLLDDDTVRGLTGLVSCVVLIVLAWGLAAALFSFGLYAIKDKEVKHRWLRIVAVFVFLPAVIIIVPIFRNRTWFF
jgi:hypothetical protein